MPSTKVVLSEHIDPRGEKMLADAGFDVVVAPATDSETLKSLIPGAFAILMRATKLDAEVIDAGDQLKIISRHGTGYDNIDVAAATAKGVLVAKVDGANAYSVGEYVIAAAMALGRMLLPSTDLMRTGELSDQRFSLPGLASKHHLNGADLRGKTLGIIGIGRIGTVAATLAHAIGMSVMAYDAYATTDLDFVTQVADIDDLYRNADFVSINAPLTPQTRNMIAAEQLAIMKPTAYVINAGRGGVINEHDLADALKAGRIAGAALDVFDNEPPAADNPLFTAPNTIVTPHIAGTTAEATQALSMGAAQAIIDFAAGKTPQFTVNPEVLAH